MKAIKSLSLAVLSIVFVLGSCSKYEEGPALSLRTKKARLAGEWQADKYVDADGTETNANDDTVIEFTKDGDYIVKNGSTTFTGTWEFVNDKESLKLTMTYSLGGASFTDENTVKIIKLKNDELWIEDEDGDQTHMIPA